MKNPLVAFGLLTVLFWLLVELRLLIKPPRIMPKTDRRTAINDSLRMLMVLGLASLLSIAFGKPGLVPQYCAWAVLVLQAVRALYLTLNRPQPARFFGVLELLALGFIWLWQTPWLGPGALP